MRKHIIILFLLVTTVIATGCKMPDTTVKGVNAQPGVIIKNAPGETTLWVDGVAVGPANKYDGDKSYLQLEPGSHNIKVKSAGGKILANKKIFVYSEVQTLQLPSE